MKYYFLNIIQIILLCFCAQSLYAATDKYRIILTTDPATSMTIAWNQISGSDQIVHFDVVDHGTDIGMYTNNQTPDRTQVYRGMNSQFVRLTGLIANTNYYFVIGDSEGNSDRYWFRTAPDDDSRLSFIAGGDSRNNRDVRRDANTLVSKLKPHAVMFGGDMINTDNDTDWQAWFDDWQFIISPDGRMIPIVPARGNHESNGTIYNLFDTPNTDAYYAITFGNNIFRSITLNSEISLVGNQLTWLQNEFLSSPNTSARWKMAQYHKPMRPHTSSKSEGDDIYNAWAQLFYDNQLRLAIDCDSHTAKTTYPIRPTMEAGHDEGFIRNDTFGTVYAGEGCWGAPIRVADDNKAWTRNSGSFNQFKLIWVGMDTIEMRTIKIENVANVGENSNTNSFQIPSGTVVWNPSNGSVVEILQPGFAAPCKLVGTICDDTNGSTSNDEEDGQCFCVGIPQNAVQNSIPISASSNDAEEDTANSGLMDLVSEDLEMITDGSKDQLVGLRFTNVNLPANATVYRAYIQFEAQNNTSNVTALTIKGELNIASETFSSEAGNISARTLTQACTDWDEILEWTDGEQGLSQRTPYLQDIINEMQSLNGWNSSSPLTFIIDGSGNRNALSFDNVSGLKPTLHIWYDPICTLAGTSCDDGDPNTILDEEDGNCNCTGIPNNAITTNKAIETNNDDAEENFSSGSMYLTSSDLELITDGTTDQLVGVRFNNTGIPPNATIHRSYIQFTAKGATSIETNLEIQGELSVKSKAFNGDTNNISDRATSTTKVFWNNIAEWTQDGAKNLEQRTPYLNSIIQEIIGQYDWSGGPITMLFSGVGNRRAYSVDGAGAAVLHVDYTIPCPKEGTSCDDGEPQTYIDVYDKNCNCAGIEFNGTLIIPVLEGQDDAEENISNGSIDLGSSDLELIQVGTILQLVGIKFNDIPLPSDAIITKAYIQFNVDEVSIDPTNLSIKVMESGDALTFESGRYDISQRAVSSQSVLWSDIAGWPTTNQAGEDQRTPDLSVLLEHALMNSDWLPMNEMGFVIEGEGKRVADSREGGSAKAAKLVIEYELCFDSLNIDWTPVRSGSYRVKNDINIQSPIPQDTIVILHHGSNGKINIPSSITNNGTILISNDGCNQE